MPDAQFLRCFEDADVDVAVNQVVEVGGFRFCVKGVDERIRAAGAFPLYLPPYSPDLTPIEKLWSKVKAILRKERARSAQLLPRATTDAFTLIRPDDCARGLLLLAFLDILMGCSRRRLYFARRSWFPWSYGQQNKDAVFANTFDKRIHFFIITHGS